MPEERKYAGQDHSDHYRLLHHILPHQKSGMRFFLPYQMPDTYRSTLCHRDAEQIGEHNNIDAIGTCGKRLHSQHIDEISDYHLRRAVRKLLPGRRQPHLHQILQLHPWERTEINPRETMDMLAEQDYEQNDHRYTPAEGSGDSSPLHP